MCLERLAGEHRVGERREVDREHARRQAQTDDAGQRQAAGTGRQRQAHARARRRRRKWRRRLLHRGRRARPIRVRRLRHLHQLIHSVKHEIRCTVQYSADSCGYR